MPRRGGYSTPLLFAVFWGVFAAVFGGLTNFGLISYDPAAWIISVLAAPPVTIMLVLISSGLTQGFVRLWMGAGNAGFETTFRVWCYSSAAYVLYAIPFAGPWVAGIYAWFLMVVGLKTAHSATTGRAFGAVLTSLVALMIISAMVGAIGPELSDRILNILLP